MRRPAAVATGVVAAIVAVAPAQAGSATKVVHLKNIKISPAKVVIERGGTVEWRFEDGRYVSHNVTSRGRKRFRSSATKSSGVYRVRFTKRGTYRYVCTLHANMKGRVVVR